MRFQRYLNALNPSGLFQSVKSFNYTQLSNTPVSTNKSKNLILKSKIIILIALIFIGTNVLLTNFIFNVDNYGQYVQSLNSMDLYLKLNKRFQGYKEFLKIFSIPNNELNLSINQNIAHNEFNHNYSSTALISYINHIYASKEQDPKGLLLNETIDFHWADWLDVQQATPFVKMYPDLLKRFGSHDAIKDYVHQICEVPLKDLRQQWDDYDLYEGRTTTHEQVIGIEICGAIEKYYYNPIPERIMLETNYHYHTVGVNPERLQDPLGKEGNAKRFYNSKHVTATQINNFKPNDQRMDLLNDLKHNYIGKGYELESFKLKPFVDQSVKAYKKPKVMTMIKKLERKQNRENVELTPTEQKRLDFLKYSWDHVGIKQPFFFTSLRIQIDVTNHELVHYSYPWMKKILNGEERLKIIHHTIRSWFKFAENAQVICWFNYGNLYGWYFNSQNLPWDTDLDVQISIQDQDRLGQYYNNTLVIENPELGDHLFFYQTNPWYINNHEGQHIDSRYIEAKSGIYIDISALWIDKLPAVSKSSDQEDRKDEEIIKFHCKNNNYFAFEDIFPLRRTIFEGAQCYIPNKPKKVLWDFYGAKCTDKKYNKDHNWQKDIGMWIPNQICENKKIPKTGDRFDDNGDLTLSGACNDVEIQRNFKLTQDQYEIHKKEFEIVVEQDGGDASSLSENELPIYRFYDPKEFQ
ncbi:hypothetical protein BN7_1928 [Wickerhamomyces ciferrii]|uniref:LicD/FKTN/FKRP nucleotidyltransferase domain-containing protein n=1 Tax=Wickerhamomyces ciferrii (strain ATCC 14091 / BCRC 22168 / CBS 111 / JCM 3599 / NBRC 0793 / NRRL Y-1031 F-60-10) TaxID=1206466 RepID=K0KMP1_WICCF|nr:uncharacterized protein BN7_1928 [Wickerhamomyces ciferrii]CCH42383.1 hypothetical protein BN7_1928 [Wickerhamomyces ciferrii]